MPELSRFFGLVIRMYFDDTDRHSAPHIHAVYGERSASLGLDGELLAGAIPVKQLRMAQAWIAIHESELRDAWASVLRHETPPKIKPLS